MISNALMQITFLSFLFKKFNIIKKGINNKDTLKLYAIMLSCLVVSYTQSQRPSSFKAIIKSIFKTNKLSFVTSAPFLQPILSPFLLRNLLKFTKSCKNASKNEIYLQEIYQSSNQEIKCLLFRHRFRCRHAVVIMQTLNWTNQCPLFMTVRHTFEISEDDLSMG
jgi:hypothetical protein